MRPERDFNKTTPRASGAAEHASEAAAAPAEAPATAVDFTPKPVETKEEGGFEFAGESTQHI